MRLRTHYFLLAFSIVVPVAVFCGIALSMLKNAQHSAAVQRVQESAALTAQVIDADLERAQAVLAVLADSHALALGDLARFHEEAGRASAKPGGWIILYGEDGKQLVNTRRDWGAELPFRPDPENVTQMLASGKGMVSGIKWGAVLQGNFVMVEVPVTTRSGQRYVIGQAFSPDYFAHSFAGRAIPSSWRVSVLDRAGIIIARSDRAGEFVGKTVRPDTLELIRNSRSGIVEHLAGDGRLMYDAYTRSSRSDWSIIIGAPVNEINATVWRGMSFMMAGVVIALLAALTLTVLAGRHLVRFVTRASRAASLLGQGAAVPALPRSAVVELERLNEAICEAGERLQAEMGSRAAAERERNELLVLEQQARASAERQNAAKDEFLAMLGHELRNPLSAVASAVSILDHARQPNEAMAERARDVLRRQTGHLRKLVDDLLEVNRALMGKLELQTETVDLADVVRRCVDTLASSGRSDGFTVRVDCEAVLVAADPTRLLQVVDNILDNAIKYSPDGGLLQVSLRQLEGEAELTVRDSGLGVAPELLPHVFDVFVQGKQSLQRASGGLGIGLSLVRRLVELHGGSVWLESGGAGQGTTVTIRLPRLTEAPPVALDKAPAIAPTRRRVLLVEDNHDARDMMSMLLEMRSCEVVSAASGPEGIALARSTQPEVAFIDIGLPGMDGYAVARGLRSDPLTANIALIALTGYGTEKDRELAVAAGFRHHFTKPIRLEDLEQALS